MATMMHSSSSKRDIPADPIEQPDCKRRKMTPMIWENKNNNLVSIEQHGCKRRKTAPITWESNNNLVSMEADQERAMLDNAVFEKLLKEKKLSLVLDLDHTLLHCMQLNKLNQEERELIVKQGMFERGLVTKLRPGLENFLKEASKMFHLHVFTKGSRRYAIRMMRLIDPGKVYFGCNYCRIFTRENLDSNGLKSLGLVVGKESGMLVLDDQNRVWREEDEDNVVVVSRYDYFTEEDNKVVGEGGKSLFAAGIDECETDGSLALSLRILKLIHTMFFEPGVEGSIFNRDVRVLKREFFDYLRATLHQLDHTTMDASANSAPESL